MKFIYFRPVQVKLQLKILDLYKYGRIFTKIFSLDEKIDVTSIQETNISLRLPKIHPFLS